ncbi:MAG: hypothetical protein ACR2J8_02385, partial [Thermomicrobiales bacterium]
VHGEAAPVETARSVRLPIPPRIQWTENHGYCGECSIQQSALYFGTYVSQFACRALLGPSQSREEVLVAVNDRNVLSMLRLSSDEFDFRRYRVPQFASWFGWVTGHLNAGHPVLMTCFVRGMKDRDYDHIMLATGFSAAKPGRYAPGDRLVFNDNFSVKSQTRRASQLADTRSMSGNGLRFRFCVPEKVDYGCAVTGIMDETGQALSVRLVLDNDREPDVLAGKPATTFRARVNVTRLIPGRTYVLYRYDDCRAVPTRGYAASAFTSANAFVAGAANVSFDASIRSDKLAIFRCLPAGV